MNIKQTDSEKIMAPLMEEFGIANKMALPKIVKVIVNVGLKEAAHDKGVLEKSSRHNYAKTACCLCH